MPLYKAVISSQSVFTIIASPIDLLPVCVNSGSMKVSQVRAGADGIYYTTSKYGYARVDKQ